MAPSIAVTVALTNCGGALPLSSVFFATCGGTNGAFDFDLDLARGPVGTCNVDTDLAGGGLCTGEPIGDDERARAVGVLDLPLGGVRSRTETEARRLPTARDVLDGLRGGSADPPLRFGLADRDLERALRVSQAPRETRSQYVSSPVIQITSSPKSLFFTQVPCKSGRRYSCRPSTSIGEGERERDERWRRGPGLGPRSGR